MRKLLHLFVFAVILGFVSCSGEEEEKKVYTVISGKLDNFKKRNITLLGYKFEKKIKFDRKLGSFTDTLPENIKPGNYILKVGNKRVPMYITPGDKVNFSVDVKNRIKDPLYNGSNAKINGYLVDKTKQFALIAGPKEKFFALNEDQFLSTLDKYKSTLVDNLNAAQLPEDFTKKELNNIHYEFAFYLNNYEDFYRILSGDEEFVVSGNYPKDIISKINFNNSDDFLFSPQYRALLDQRLKNIANKRTQKDGDFHLTHLETVQTEVTDTLIKNEMLYKLAEKQITYTSILQEYYNKFMGYSTNATHKKAITDTYEKLKLTARGQDSPKFQDYQNYDGTTTSLDDLIGHGKYLYIDVWATWCGFCKKEIPLLKRFEQQYHGKNIEFVSINVDTKDKFEKWKETIEEKEMGGVQLFAGDRHQDLQFTKDYLIKGLPRFILIDPEGKIVTSNAPRPSDGSKLEEIFDALEI